MKPLLLIITIAVSFSLPAQEAPHQSYYFDGDEVVFEFDLRYYEGATKHKKRKGDILDFDDINIMEVALAGNFNNWSRDEWKMKKVGSGRYQLRKPIAAFDDAFHWEFKFVINGKYWAEPGEALKNKSKVVQDGEFWEDVYNESLYTAEYDPDGNAYFYLPGFPEAEVVKLSGSFNGWSETAFDMTRTDGGWETTLDLPPGVYEYKFIVDGEWMEDPRNPNTRSNRYHTLNSILEITKTVNFWLEGFAEAERVVLSGSFNDWATDGILMERQGDAWLAQVDLPGGKHWYKFIVDGEWMTDPDNPIKEHDGSGYINSVLSVY